MYYLPPPTEYDNEILTIKLIVLCYRSPVRGKELFGARKTRSTKTRLTKCECWAKRQECLSLAGTIVIPGAHLKSLQL